jgi:predicted RecB family nuclease
MEQKLVCQWYGGTYDLLLSINDKNYVVDFKTSNQFNYKYLIQSTVYKSLLEGMGYNIDGIIILRLSKKDISFSTLTLLTNIKEHNEYMQKLLNFFNSMVYSFYNKVYSENNFDRIAYMNYNNYE